MTHPYSHVRPNISSYRQIKVYEFSEWNNIIRFKRDTLIKCGANDNIPFFLC